MRPDQAYTIVKHKKRTRHVPFQLQEAMRNQQRALAERQWRDGNYFGAIDSMVQANGIQNREQLSHRIPDEWRQRWPRLWGR